MDLTKNTTEALKVIDAEYSVETGHKIAQPIVTLFCRDEDRNYREVEVEGFRPYFYMSYEEFVENATDVCNDRHVLAIEADFSGVEWGDSGSLVVGQNDDPESVASTIESTANDTSVYHTPETFDALDGTKLVKVITIEPSHVGKIRDYWDRTWEADVPFERRFLISSDIYHGVEVPVGAQRVRYENWDGHSSSDERIQEISPCEPPDVHPRMLVVDIEVRTNGGGVPDPANAQNEMTAITAYDNYEDEYAGWILQSEQWDRSYEEDEFHDDVLSALSIDLECMHVFDHEGQMIEDFHQWVLERNFDLATGWNCIPHDEEVLMEDGSRVPIEDVSVGDNVVGVDGDEATIATVENKMMTGVKETVEVQTKSGENIRSTPDHEILVGTDTGVEWKDAGTVSQGDYVLTVANHPSGDTDHPVSSKRAYQYGLIASDGHLQYDEGVRFYNTRDELHEQFDTGNAVSENDDGSKSQRVFTDKSRNDAVAACESIGIPSGAKTDGEWDLSPLMSWDDDLIASFLAGMMDGDGTVSHTASIAAANETCRYWIKRLCRRLGVWATSGEQSVHIGRSSVEQFASVIGEKMNHSEKRSAVMDLSDSKSGRSETIPGVLATDGTDTSGDGNFRRVNEYLSRDGVSLKRHHAESAGSDRADEYTDFVFDKVVGVVEDKTVACYDIETSESSYVASERVVHNCNGFDYPYIIQRSYNTSAYSIRDWSINGSPFNAGDEWPDPVIDGIVLFDMLDAYKKTQYRDLRSYKLEDVAQAELDMGKVQLEESLDDAWHKQPIEFMRYNVRDVQAVVEIEQSSSLIDLYDNMRQVTGAMYTVCNNNGPMLDTLFLRMAYDEGVALTTNEAPEQGDYHGAHVFDPVPGTHENVVYPDLACFTPDTEVVTPDGVVSITDLDVGDVVYSIDPETGTVTKKPVTETHEYPEYDGELVDIESTRADFRVTPNHQMVFKSPHSGDTLRMEAGSVSDRSYLKFLSEWEYTDNAAGISTVHIPEYLDSSSYDVLARYSEHGHAFRASLPDSCTKKRANYHDGFVFSGDTYEQHRTALQEQSDSLELTHPDGTGTTFRPIEFDGDDFIEFIGWYITEGSVYNSERDRSATVRVAQEDGDVLDDVASLLERNGIEPHVGESAVEFSSPLYAEMLTDLCGDNSASKTVPDFVFEDASIEQKKLLLDTLLRGDGHNDIYYTSSDQLAEDVVRLCVETGHKPIRRKRDRTTVNGHTEWEIQTTHVNDGIDPDTHVSESTADNGVYCVTVEDNHTLLAGRNGKFQWVGQSLYPYILWTLNISPETMYTTKQAYRNDGYTDEQVFTAYIDTREWNVMSSGESLELSEIDEDQYKGVHDETGSRKKKTSQGFDGIFDPQFHEIYFVKPSVEEGFIRSTIDMLVDLKYRYKGQGDMYSAVKRVTNSCLTPDTNVLTPDGIRNITDIEVGDDVYSWNPETNQMEVKQVTDTVHWPDYSGDMVDIETSRIDFSLTPDHDMWVKRRRKTDTFEKTEAGTLNDYTRYELPNNWTFDHSDSVGDTIDVASLIASCDDVDRSVEREDGMFCAGNGAKNIPCVWNTEDFVEFIGWYVTEGNTYDNGGSGWYINIAQHDTGDGDRDAIRDLFERVGLNYYECSTYFRLSSKVLGQYLDCVCGKSSADKKLPDWVWGLSKQQKQVLHDTLMSGDGDRYSGNRYSTQSAILRDQFMCLSVELGYNTRYGYDSDCWRVRFDTGSNTFQMNRTENRGAGSTSEAPDDGVYCVTVEDNHTIVAGRNGKFNVVGQCYGVLGDSASGGKGFRLFDWRLAEAITLSGQKVINYTADQYIRLINEYSEEAGYDPASYMVGGDTDSVQTAIPQAPDYGTALAWAQRASAEFQTNEDGSPGLYDEFMQEQFGVIHGEDEHKMDVEIESLGSRLFFMQDYDADDDVAVKKRYAQHMIWDEDDGWLHEDLQDRCTVSLDDYENGILDTLDPHDQVGIKGFEYVRSDSATVTKEAQLNVLTYILLADEPSDEIYTYLSGLIDEIRDGDCDVSKLGRPKGISNPLDDYGWKTTEELENDSNYTVTAEDEENGGRYISTPSPTYRGAKYADDHFQWEDISAGSKPIRFYIDKVRGDEYPAAYRYGSYPVDDRPDPLEVGKTVDAIAVDDPDRLPEQFVLDVDKMIEKELQDKIEDILRTIGEDWDSIVGSGRQVGLDSFY